MHKDLVHPSDIKGKYTERYGNTLPAGNQGWLLGGSDLNDEELT